MGWDNFLEGRISTLFLEVVSSDLNLTKKGLTPSRWGTKFIQHLLALTHKQWLFRNSHVHYKKLDGMTADQHDAIFARVCDLMWTDPRELLEKDTYLLEKYFGDLGEASSAERQVWIASMESALKASAFVKSGKQY